MLKINKCPCNEKLYVSCLFRLKIRVCVGVCLQACTRACLSDLTCNLCRKRLVFPISLLLLTWPSLHRNVCYGVRTVLGEKLTPGYTFLSGEY